MFSFAEMDRKNRVQLAIGNSKWSEPLSLEAVGSVQDVALPTHTNIHHVHIGVYVEEGVGMVIFPSEDSLTDIHYATVMIPFYSSITDVIILLVSYDTNSYHISSIYPEKQFGYSCQIP